MALEQAEESAQAAVAAWVAALAGSCPGSGGGIGGGVFRVGGGVSAPVVLVNPSPEYSEEARKAKYQGIVVLWLVVGSDGKPRDLKVRAAWDGTGSESYRSRPSLALPACDEGRNTGGGADQRGGQLPPVLRELLVDVPKERGNVPLSFCLQGCTGVRFA